MLNADVHLLLLRPTRVPVAGEAVSEGFQGQVELDGWSWSFHNEEEKKRADKRDDRYQKTKALVDSRGSKRYRMGNAVKDAARERSDENEAFKKAMEKDDFGSEEARQRFMRDHFTKLADIEKGLANTLHEYETGDSLTPETEDDERSRIAAELDRNKNFEFTFTKRVDISTTQLLNSMKSGDVFPSGVLTIHQRSTNAGLSLVINVQRVRLLDYNLRCETSETMTTMREEWTAEFGSLAYVYKSKDMVYLSSSLSQNVPRAMTQGQVRAFAMKNIGSPI